MRVPGSDSEPRSQSLLEPLGDRNTLFVCTFTVKRRCTLGKFPETGRTGSRIPSRSLGSDGPRLSLEGSHRFPLQDPSRSPLRRVDRGSTPSPCHPSSLLTTGSPGPFPQQCRVDGVSDGPDTSDRNHRSLSSTVSHPATQVQVLTLVPTSSVLSGS